MVPRISFTFSRLLCTAFALSSFSANAGSLYLSDDAALYNGMPLFSWCDPGGVPGDGIINYNSATASDFCATEGGGLAVSFQLQYGLGMPSGISGVTEAGSYITFTDVIVDNLDTRTRTDGYYFVSPILLNGPNLSTGTVLSGTVEDIDGNGSVSAEISGTAGIDYGGSNSIVNAVISGPTAAFGNIPFFGANASGPAPFQAVDSVLVASLYFTLDPGEGFRLPGSLDVIALNEGATWNPTVVPLPGAIWLMGTGMGMLLGSGWRRKRKLQLV